MLFVINNTKWTFIVYLIFFVRLDSDCLSTASYFTSYFTLSIHDTTFGNNAVVQVQFDVGTMEEYMFCPFPPRSKSSSSYKSVFSFVSITVPSVLVWSQCFELVSKGRITDVTVP
jgi:hypothetical protein